MITINGKIDKFKQGQVVQILPNIVLPKLEGSLATIAMTKKDSSIVRVKLHLTDHYGTVSLPKAALRIITKESDPELFI